MKYMSGGSVGGLVAISAGKDHTLVLRSDGVALAWGSEGHWQLGNDQMVRTREMGLYDHSFGAVEVTGLTYVSAVAAGHRHSLAMKADGTLWGWGYNDYSQIGKLGDASTHVQPLAGQMTGLTPAPVLAAGGSHTLWLQNGASGGGGGNGYAQLGDGTQTSSSEPVPALATPAPAAAPTWNSPATGDLLSVSATLSATATTGDGGSWTATFEAHGSSGYDNLLATLTGSAAAAGSPSSATWNIDLDRGTYYLRARADAGGQVSEWTALGAIQVDRPPAAPTGLSPGGGGWAAGYQPTLTWTFADPDSGDSQSAYQVVFKADGVTVHDSGKVTGTAGNYTLPSGIITGATGIAYTWTVRTWDQNDVAGDYAPAASFQSDTHAPAARASALAAYQNSRSFTIPWTWEREEIGAGEAGVYLYVSTDDGKNWQRGGATFVASPIAYTATQDGAHAFYVAGVDLVGNEDTSVDAFTNGKVNTIVDTAASEGIVSIAPGPGTEAGFTNTSTVSHPLGGRRRGADAALGRR